MLVMVVMGAALRRERLGVARLEQRLELAQFLGGGTGNSGGDRPQQPATPLPAGLVDLAGPDEDFARNGIDLCEEKRISRRSVRDRSTTLSMAWEDAMARSRITYTESARRATRAPPSPQRARSPPSRREQRFLRPRVKPA